MTIQGKFLKRRQVAIYLLVGLLCLSMSTLPAFTAGPKGQTTSQSNMHGRGILPVTEGGVNSSGITVGSQARQIKGIGGKTNQGISAIDKMGMTTNPNGYFVTTVGNEVLLGRPGSNVVLKMNSQQNSVPGNAAIVKSSGGNELILAAGDVFFKTIIKNHFASSPHTELETNGNKGPGEYKWENKSDGKWYRWRYRWRHRWRHRKPEDPPPNNPPDDPPPNNPPDDPPNDPPEDPEPPEVFVEAAPLPKELIFKMGECPALMAMATEELGLKEENPRIYFKNVQANSEDIQPCDMCARLMNSASILRDLEGNGIAALNQVVHEFVSSPMPISEEQMASIIQALSDFRDDDDKPHYSSAIQWLDALAEYSGILTNEIGWPAEESITFVAEKYVMSAMENGDEGLAMFLKLQLDALNGS